MGAVVDSGLQKKPEDTAYDVQEDQYIPERNHRGVLSDYTSLNVPTSVQCWDSDLVVVNAHPSLLRQTFYEYSWRAFSNIDQVVLSHTPLEHDMYRRAHVDRASVWRQICDKMSMSCVSLMRHFPSPGAVLAKLLTRLWGMDRSYSRSK